jgi:hypothetical protein
VSRHDYTLHFAVAAKCEDDEDARELADVLGAKLTDSFDVFRVRASAPRPYRAADFETTLEGP